MGAGDNRLEQVLPIVFYSSFAGLGFEICLMRAFGVSLSYHFAFMVISIAMLGIAASGTALSMAPALKEIERIPLYGLLFAACLPLSSLLANAAAFDPARLSWDRLQLVALGLQYVVLSVPFFFFGLIVSTAYAGIPREANAVYASDLAGAGCGALAAAWLLSLGGPGRGIVILSSLLATGIVSLARGKTRIAALLLLLLNLAVLFVRPELLEPRMSSYKPLEVALRLPGARRLGTAYSPSARIDLFTGPAARFAPGLSFRYRDPLPDQTGLAIDGGEIHAITSEKDASRMRFLHYLPCGLVHQLATKDDVLVIEPRGGLAVLLAKELGARTVLGIDSNPLVIETVREFSRMQGSALYNENARSGLARTRLTTAARTFDVIDLSLMGSFPAAVFGFSEDYRLTVEAFRQYIRSLRPDGFLSVNLYILPPPRAELRLLATIAQAAEEMGISDISDHLAAIRSWDTVTILVKRSGLTGEDMKRIKGFSRQMKFDLVYYPGIRPEESNVHIRTQTNEYFDAFRSLIDPRQRSGFISKYLFDITPTTDERPFFHYYLKLGNSREIFRVMGKKWQFFMEEGYLLPALLLQAGALSAALLCLPLIKLKFNAKNTYREGAPASVLLGQASVAKENGGQGNATGTRNAVLPLGYFALLGLAFLFVEVVLVQKMVLALESPSAAASTVIACVLISSGIGSLVSSRVKILRKNLVLPVLGGIVFAYAVLLPGMIDLLLPYPLLVRIVLAAIAIIPLGFLLGIPFPLGMTTLGKTAPQLIPWAWAVNGCFSVLSPVLAIMLALSTGYSAVLMTGAGMYLLAYLVMRKQWSQ